MRPSAAAAGVRFRVLGTVGVRAEHGTAAPAGVRQQAVLAYLLLNAGARVSAEQLADALWGDDAPSSSAAGVRVAVSKVRRFLEDVLGAGHLLETVAGGYVLRARPEDVDAHLFTRLAAEGRALLRAGDAAAALAVLDEALALWSGDAFGDARYEPFALREARLLGEQRLDAVEDRLEAALATGRDEHVISRLQQLVAAEPLRERPRELLMLALYRAGRQQDALAVYRETRDVLDRELGLAPSPPLQRLERRILEQDPSLEPLMPRALAAPRPRRRSWQAALAASVLVAVAAAAVATLAPSGSETPLSHVPADSVALVDPNTGNAVRVVAVGAAPNAVAAGNGVLWVGNFASQTLSRVDMRTRRVSSAAVTSAAPTAVTTGFGAVWVTDRSSGEIVRVDPRTGEALVHIRLAYGAAAVAAGAGAVWVADETRGLVFRIDPTRNAVSQRIPLAGPVAVATGGGAVWVSEAYRNDVARIDPRTNAVTRIPTSLPPDAIAYTPSALWVTHPLQNAVSRIDLATHQSQLIGVGREPTTIVADRAHAWVVNDLDHSVFELDARTGLVTRRVVLSRNGGRRDTTPGGLAAAPGGVWLAVQSF